MLLVPVGQPLTWAEEVGRQQPPPLPLSYPAVPLAHLCGLFITALLLSTIPEQAGIVSPYISEILETGRPSFTHHPSYLLSL